MAALAEFESRLPFALPAAAAGAAHPLPVLGDVEIVPGKRMPMNAMGLLGLLRGMVRASQDVFSVSDHLKVVWAHAKRCATEMVKRHVRSHGPVFLLPNPAVGAGHLSLARQPKRSVLAAVAGALASRPYPALSKVWRVLGNRPGFINLLPESFVRIFVSHWGIVPKMERPCLRLGIPR